MAQISTLQIIIIKNTTLHTAVCGEQYEIICTLLYYEVDADEPDDYDKTPFLMALTGRDTDIQELSWLM